MLYSDGLKTVILVKLTCPAEENIADARLRKEIKYTPLKTQITGNAWTCHLYTIEVGARGFVSSSVPHLSIYLSIYLYIYLSIYRSIYSYIYLSVYIHRS